LELVEAVLGRRMCRSFLADPLPAAAVDGLLNLAQRAPSAGNTQGWQWLVLDTPTATERYWSVTLAAERRATFPWPGLLRAPVLLVPYADADAYVRRYGEADKLRRPSASPDERDQLARSVAGWPMPYWLVDTAMAAMTVLLAAVDAGLGASFFGQFDHEAAVRSAFGVPDGLRAIGTIALGRPDTSDAAGGAGDRRSLSTRQRPRPPLSEVVHRTSWT
jgi:nitroreductase